MIFFVIVLNKWFCCSCLFLPELDVLSELFFSSSLFLFLFFLCVVFLFLFLERKGIRFSESNQFCLSIPGLPNKPWKSGSRWEGSSFRAELHVVIQSQVAGLHAEVLPSTKQAVRGGGALAGNPPASTCSLQRFLKMALMFCLILRLREKKKRFCFILPAPACSANGSSCQVGPHLPLNFTIADPRCSGLSQQNVEVPTVHQASVSDQHPWDRAAPCDFTVNVGQKCPGAGTLLRIYAWRWVAISNCSPCCLQGSSSARLLRCHSSSFHKGNAWKKRSRSLRIKNIARGGHGQLPRAKRERHCECASAGRRIRPREPSRWPRQRSARPRHMHVHPYCRLRP